MRFNWIILLAIPAISAARIQLIDIDPEEAQRLITQQSLDLRYAKKLGEGSAAGRSYNGKVINSDDYTEEIYEANQFHGQDGLGRAIFGYTDNRQSRLEARNANGEVRGQYQYLDPNGNDIQVQYWVDSLGFHQTDNLPKIELQPVTETPEVRAARLTHEKLWKEAARLNGIDVDSSDLYSSIAEKLDSDRYDDDDEEGDNEGQVSNQHQSLARYPVLPYSGHIVPENAKTFGKVVDDSVVVEARKNEARSRFARQQTEEVTSEPRGFFYSFDYPAPFIVDHNAKTRQTHEGQASEAIESIIDIRLDNEDKIESIAEKPNEIVDSQRVSRQIPPKIKPLVPEKEEKEEKEVNEAPESSKKKKLNSRGSVKFASRKN